jgi:Fe-S oxidoreductase
VLEPSCAAVFRDELVALLPHDEDAKRLSLQTLTLAEYLRQEASAWEPPPVGGHALLHGHCHQKAVIGLDAERELLERAGVDVEVPDLGCCGLAGSFGFEAPKYELSMAVGEHRFLPALRGAGAGARIVADGFSCRTQAEHGTRRRPQHLAEVLASALP